MGTPIATEVYVFLGMVLLGAGWGLLFDLFRVFRRVARPGFLAVSISDILFWMLSLALVSGTMLYFNNGQLRWYVFLGILLGGIFYFLLFSRLILTALVKLLEILLKFLHFIFKILLTPLGFLYKILIVPICGCFHKIMGLAAGRIKQFLNRGKPHEKRAHKKRKKNRGRRVCSGHGSYAGKGRHAAAADYPE